MWFSSWLAKRLRSAPSGRGHESPRKRLTYRPRLEALEDRWLPSQIGLTVTSLADSGISPNICRAVEGSIASVARGLIVDAQCRSACVHGQKAGAPPPSQHRPHATFAPARSASVEISSASRVLPIPGSPVRQNS